MLKAIVGIDPGKDGALVSLVEGDEPEYLLARHHFTALTGKGARRDYVTQGMVQALRGLKNGCDEVEIYIERQAARPGRRPDARVCPVCKSNKEGKEGVVSSFSTGFGFGLWLGIAAALDIPVFVIPPQTWVAAVLKGAQGEGKARAVFVAGRVLPTLELVPKGCRVPHSGLADAACLAIYGRDHYKS